MKTKIILIIVITLIGIGFLTAFKQSEGNRKYLTMTINGRDLNIIDEKGIVTEKKMASVSYQLKGIVDVTNEINSISDKGYKLINAFNYNSTGGTSIVVYIFEKE
jgi:hypothetical protein